MFEDENKYLQRLRSIELQQRQSSVPHSDNYDTDTSKPELPRDLMSAIPEENKPAKHWKEASDSGSCKFIILTPSTVT